MAKERVEKERGEKGLRVRGLAASASKGSAKLPTTRPAVHFKVELADLNAHLFHVTLSIANPAAQQRLSLPVWIPGSYLVREFSKNLQGLAPHQGAAKVKAEQLDKNTWQLACDPAKALTVTYSVYALDNSVRTAWLDASRGFFNGTSLFLRVQGRTESPHEVDILAPRGVKTWQLATGLNPVKVNNNGFGRYSAASYDELVDCPVEMGEFWSGSFTACGVPHRFVVAGRAPSFDGARLLADARKICAAEIQFWHPGVERKASKDKPPHKNYVFMLNAVDEGYGGLEHRNSTALICNRKDLPRQGDKAFDNGKLTEGYTTLLGLISHEYFHTWNVKRLRPAEFASYDYGAENYTQLLWFFEGFTSYYDDLLLCRAGLIDGAAYLKLLNKTINQVLQTPGRLLQSAAQASFDAWVKYYRQDENTPNATVSYYTKGALVALCLDLTLRLEGKTTLDDVMRSVWARARGGPMQEVDLLAVLWQCSGRSFEKELAAWAHGTAELPLKTLLEKSGVTVHEDPAQWAQVLGLRVQEGSGVVIKTVLRGGAAEVAGFAAGDEWLAVEVGAGKSSSAWRIGKIDELALYLQGAQPAAGRDANKPVKNQVAVKNQRPVKSQIQAIVARDKRLVRLALTVPEKISTWRLQAAAEPASKWYKSG
jgi:predicted metalloprotease with PDZ domain